MAVPASAHRAPRRPRSTPAQGASGQAGGSGSSAGRGSSHDRGHVSPCAPRPPRREGAVGALRRGLIGPGAPSEAAAPSARAGVCGDLGTPASGAGGGREGQAFLRRCRPGAFWGRGSRCRVCVGVGRGCGRWGGEAGVSALRVFRDGSAPRGFLLCKQEEQWSRAGGWRGALSSSPSGL